MINQFIKDFSRIKFILIAILTFFIFMTTGGCSFQIKYIFSSSNEMIDNPGHEKIFYKDIWFMSEDGIQLHGWLVPSDSNFPLVLFFHGNAANISHRVPIIKYLHDIGFPVFIFDYRGYGESKGNPISEEDLYKDGRGALIWLQERGWETDNIVYFGRSMGASVALQMAIETPPQGVVLEAPFTSLREIASKLSPITYAIFGWWSIGDQFDNTKKISNICSPLVIIHGENDKIVPSVMSSRLYQIANEPKSLILIKGANHSNSYEIDKDAYKNAWGRLIGLAPRENNLTMP